MRSIQPFQGWRLTFFQGIIFAVFLIFSIRMYQLQIVDNESARIASDDNRLSELPIAAPRGVIFDRNDRTLAGNSPAFNVTIIPAELPDDPEQELEIFNRLSALVGVPPTRAAAAESESGIRSIEELVADGLSFAPFQPVVIAFDVDRLAALQIRESSYEMPGVGVDVVSVREYPYGALTAHVVGYTGPIGPDEALRLIELGYNPAFDRVGYDGIERSLESSLSGQRGEILREVDVVGEVIRVLQQTDPVGGQNLRLTIDIDLQEAAQQALIDQITSINTTAQRIVTETGVVLAMNPNTGEIMAMVSYPSYDASRFARFIDEDYYFQLIEDPLTPLVNHAIGSVYPPGSAWKLITATGVMEENVIDPESRLFDGGDLLVANYYAENDRAADQRFVCWLRTGHDLLNMRGAIANSCNVYFYQVGGGNPAVPASVLREGGLGITDLFRYATALGIGSYTGVELLGEIPTRMPDPDWKRRVYGQNWSTGDTYNAAFGQGYINVTPLQLINSVAAIVNDGTLYQPTIVREFLDPEGNIIQPFAPQVIRTVNLEAADPDGTLVLLPLEDMIIHGPESLACTCEPGSDSFNPNRCNPNAYRATVDIDPTEFGEDIRNYRVTVPETFSFEFTSICQPVRFDDTYTPAFLSTDSMQIVREGMRMTVVQGTAGGADLPYIDVAGKTGTAEYCDDIANALGLCIPGGWPAHAWFTAYAPYGDPEILIIALIYNGEEGSANALPVVIRTLEEYIRLRNEREDIPLPSGLGLGIQPTNPAPATPIPEETPAAP
jgi:penicillin-binding protein 2